MIFWSLVDDSINYQIMIELPEAVVLSKEINDALSGKTILNVVTAQSPHKFAWYHKNPESYNELLVNSTIQKSYNQGGFVRIDLNDEKTILLSEGIKIRYILEGEQLPQKHQLLIEFSGHSYFVCSIQMYGGLCAFRKGDYDNDYYGAARGKPSPLTEPFDQKYFEHLLIESSEKLSLKGFLATEQRIPGLGNGVLQDILFNAKLHPKRKIKSLSQGNKNSLFASIKSTLLQMTNDGGRDTERDIFGYSGSYQTQLCKNTVGNPCQICDTVIRKQAYMGGSIYFCPCCQEL
jgi:formamidopyrimidine-DNA glycosylase